MIMRLSHVDFTLHPLFSKPWVIKAEDALWEINLEVPIYAKLDVSFCC